VKAAREAGTDAPPPEVSYLAFFSSRQLDSLARIAIEGAADIKAFLKNKENKARVKAAANQEHSIDVALFGRMVADAADLNVDAAAQVAHAISVHAVANEADYFTAVDDRNDDSETGAGMIGTIDFNSATLYRYAAVDVDRLAENLGTTLAGTDGVRRAVEAFLKGFVESMPTGKANTFANHTLPDVVIVKIRDTRPVNFVGAFEEAVIAVEGSGHLRPACAKLAEHIADVEKNYGGADAPAWIMRMGSATDALAGLPDPVDLDTLIAGVGKAVAERLAESA
jgi:CRISPR system Cascade subunit CasC